MMSQEKMKERKATATEIKSWVEKVMSAYHNHVGELSDEYNKKRKISFYTDILEKELLKQFRDWCESNKDRAVIDTRYYHSFSPSEFKFNKFNCKEFDDVDVELKLALDNFEIEMHDIVDILYANPTRDDFETVRKWCDKYKREELKCSESQY